MTPTELRDAIAADPTAAALADIGDDTGCAARMAAILPPVLVSTYINERGVFAAVADPAAAEAFMQGLEAVADSASPSAKTVKRSLSWMEPANGGVDLSFPSVRAMLDQLATARVLDAGTVATIKALAERPASVSADDVGRAMRPDRLAAQEGN